MSDLDNEEIEATRLLKNLEKKELDELIKSTEGSIEETCKFLKDNSFIEYKEKSADELFEELGYSIVCRNDKVTDTLLIYEKELLDMDKHIKRIIFYGYKEISCTQNYFYLGQFDIDELKAINKKCEELKWI